jgi:hypothetical protein
VNLLEHATDANEVVVEDLFGCIEQLEDRFVTHRIVDVRTLLPCYDNISVPQDSELLRRVGLLNIETLTNLVDGQFAIAKTIKNRYSQRMSQRLKKLRFEVTQLLPHSNLQFIPNYFASRIPRTANMRICIFLHMLERKELARQIV